MTLIDASEQGWITHEYLRVSKDKSGRERSPDEQHDDHERTRGQRGWQLGRIYRDVGSASRYARKARGNFGKLLVDLESGEFGAQVLQLWEIDRGSRKESEWLRMIEACEEHSVLIWVHTHRRLYDCSVRRDRKSLLEDAIEAADYSAKLSEAVLRGVSANADAGLPHGRVPYGYSRIYDQRTGRMLEQVLNENEAPIVKELFQRWNKAEPLTRIARDFMNRGIEKRSGGPFNPAHLRSMLLNPTYAGIRVHDPLRSERGRRVGDGANQVKGTWPSIVSAAAFHRAQMRLNDSSRRTHKGPRPGAAKHFLTATVRCDACGGPMYIGKRSNGGYSYVCKAKTCTSVGKDQLEEYVEKIILAWLSDPGQYSALAQPGEDADAELQAVRDDLDKARGELLDLARRVGTGELSLEFAGMAEPGIRERIARLESRESQLTHVATLDGLITPGPDVQKRWKALPATARREIARRLLVPSLIGELRIVRCGKGRWRTPVHERIVFRRD